MGASFRRCVSLQPLPPRSLGGRCCQCFSVVQQWTAVRFLCAPLHLRVQLCNSPMTHRCDDVFLYSCFHPGVWVGVAASVSPLESTVRLLCLPLHLAVQLFSYTCRHPRLGGVRFQCLTALHRVVRLSRT